jgi:chromosome segregation ATPase
MEGQSEQIPSWWERLRALSTGRLTMLEVQNRALIRLAAERAQRLERLETARREADQRVERLKAEHLTARELYAQAEQALQRARAEAEEALRQARAEAEEALRQAHAGAEEARAEAEQHKAAQEELRAAYERLKTEAERLEAEGRFYSGRVHELDEYNRQLTEAATKYSLWGQKLERELAEIDPAGASTRRFTAQVFPSYPDPASPYE